MDFSRHPSIDKTCSRSEFCCVLLCHGHLSLQSLPHGTEVSGSHACTERTVPYWPTDRQLTQMSGLNRLSVCYPLPLSLSPSLFYIHPSLSQRKEELAVGGALSATCGDQLVYCYWHFSPRSSHGWRVLSTHAPHGARCTLGNENVP